MKQKVLLSSAYLGPIQYYSKLFKYDKVHIEINDNFVKQTYRNRCRIYGANGILQLSIPVKKDNTKTKVKDLRIGYETNWQKLHWKSIESAYRSSPFFEYYADDFLQFYNQKYDFLYDYNSAIQNVVLELLGHNIQMNYTDEYIEKERIDFDDLRDEIHPKRALKDIDFQIVEYTQVFTDKLGFKENLSIIDLLFNEGPNAINIIKSH